MWLGQAMNQLVQSLGLGAEASMRAMLSGENDRHFGVAYFSARLVGSQISVSFSAFAAESAINRFLVDHLAGRDLETALRLSPAVEKFTVGTRLVLGKSAFPRDEQTYEKLRVLFGLRNKLVHAKPKKLSHEEVYGAAAFDDFHPHAAYTHLMNVIEARLVLLRHSDPPVASGYTENLREAVLLMEGRAQHASQMRIPTNEEISAELLEAQAAHPDMFMDTP